MLLSKYYYASEAKVRIINVYPVGKHNGQYKLWLMFVSVKHVRVLGSMNSLQTVRGLCSFYSHF